MIIKPLKAGWKMQLDRIMKPLEAKAPASVVPAITVRGLAYDSRKVKPCYLFVALPGRHTDGTQFIDEALSRGAVAVVGEAPLALRHVPYWQVEDSRAALADIANFFFEHPAASLKMLGITGTNGKTTTAFMLRAVLEADQRRTGLISTVRYEIGERVLPAQRTTPEAPDLQALLRDIKRAGRDHVVMEVSSHALDQQRVRGIEYDVAIFTNVSRDHLDYHGDMESYYAAKRKLFTSLGQGEKEGVAVINTDDPYGQRLARELVGQSRTKVWTYGVESEADVRAAQVILNTSRSAFRVQSPWGDIDVALSLLGRFNIDNALASLTAAAAMGVPLDRAVEALGRLDCVPGRLQPVPWDGAFKVFVDYAHTDDALRKVCEITREITAGRLLLVFGCGGNRDRSKRPAMGSVADQFADFTWITSDNPRNEDPAAIATEIASGFSDATKYALCLDRAEAIATAINEAGPGDTVLIAGKGHETYQEFENTVVPFDDAETARRALHARL